MNQLRPISEILNNQPQFLRLPIKEIASLYEGGLSLIPLGGEDGKTPLVGFAGRNRLPLDVVTDKLTKANSNVYGVRLKGLTVVDVDKDDKANRAYVKKRFGHSLLTVQTPRGLHLYFAGETPNMAIKENNLAIDIKSGENSYVVGAGSIRPDGGEYKFLIGDYSKIKQLPPFKDAFVKAISDQVGKVKEGERFQRVLFPKAIEFSPCCDSLEELIQELQGEVNYLCENPETIAQSEIIKTAKWAWQKRLENSLYAGEHSAVKTTNFEFKRLMEVKDGELGLALLHTLRHNHSGKRRIGKPFPICRQAMEKANIINGWKSDKYQRAKIAILKVGLIKLTKRGGLNKGASLYQFNLPQHHKKKQESLKKEGRRVFIT